MKIFVATHKKFNLPEGINKNIYLPIQVGTSNDDLGYLREDNLDNISHKNSNFCELTILYYIWKNIDADIVGLVHYRRYLYKKEKFKRIGFLYIPWKSTYRLFSKDDIENILSKYDIIIPKANYLQEDKNIRLQYGRTHHIEDWDITREVIKEIYPDYLDSFDNIANGNFFYGCNMFISKKTTITPYFKWLFDILFEVEKRVDISNYSDYQKRIFGFLSERLFTVWIIHHKNNLKIYETKFKLVE